MPSNLNEIRLHQLQALGASQRDQWSINQSPIKTETVEEGFEGQLQDKELRRVNLEFNNGKSRRRSNSQQNIPDKIVEILREEHENQRVKGQFSDNQSTNSQMRKYQSQRMIQKSQLEHDAKNILRQASPKNKNSLIQQSPHAGRSMAEHIQQASNQLYYMNYEEYQQQLDQQAAFIEQNGDRFMKIRKEMPEFRDASDQQVNQIMQLYHLNNRTPIRPSSTNHICQGTFFLWICWLFYTSGASVGFVPGEQKNLPSKVVMNTIVASSAASVTAIFFRPLFVSIYDPTDKYPLKSIANSLIVGLVSITGACNNVEVWAAAIIGFLGTLIYMSACKLYIKFKIDDPNESSQIHAFGGLWGLWSAGFFDRDQGLLYTGSFNQLLKQTVGALAIIIWAVLTSLTFFYTLKRVKKFRVGQIFEITGQDALMDGGIGLLTSDILSNIESKQRSIANASKLKPDRDRD